MNLGVKKTFRRLQMAYNTSEEFLEEWNTEFEKNSLGNVIVLCLYMLCGITGNCIVLVVYKYQMKDVSGERYFIPILAAADVIACVVCSVLDLIFLLLHLNYTNSIYCKVAVFLICCTGATSIFLLMCIAIQRYLKICKNITLSLQRRRLMIICSFVFSIAMALPLSLTYDHIQFSSGEYTIGKRCGKIEYESQLKGAAYGIAFSSMSLLILASFVFLYGRIGCTIYGHMKPYKFKRTIARLSRNFRYSRSTDFQTKQSSKEADVVLNEEQNQALSETKLNHLTLTDKPEPHNDKTSINEGTVSQNEGKIVTAKGKTSRVSFNCKNELKTPHPLHKRNRRVKNKFSLMFMIITCVFVVSTAPVSTILTLEGIFPKFWENLSRKQLIIVLWLYHTYLINNFINPFIYAFMDDPFRNAAKTLFQKCVMQF